jgi:hypothetical protein
MGAIACEKNRAAQIINVWLQTGLLKIHKKPTRASKGKDRDCVSVDSTKRPGQEVRYSL